MSEGKVFHRAETVMEKACYLAPIRWRGRKQEHAHLFVLVVWVDVLREGRPGDNLALWPLLLKNMVLYAFRYSLSSCSYSVLIHSFIEYNLCCLVPKEVILVSFR